MNFYQASVENWPEDEAIVTADLYKSRIEEDGLEYADQWIVRERAHISTIMNIDELSRYDGKLKDLLEG